MDLPVESSPIVARWGAVLGVLIPGRRLSAGTIAAELRITRGRLRPTLERLVDAGFVGVDEGRPVPLYAYRRVAG